MRRRSIAMIAAALVAAVASVVAVSVVWPGLDARQTPPEDTAVWALQTGQGRRYARVNTAIGELDTVRQISNPSAVAQTGQAAFLFSESYGRLTRIDQAEPSDLDDQTLRSSPSTPAGTVEAAVSGDYVVYRTDAGAVYAGTLSGSPVQLRPDGAKADAAPYSAQAVAVDDAGTVFAYSKADQKVLRYSIPHGQVAGADRVSSAPTGVQLQLTAADGTWFLLDTDTGRLWRRGASTTTVRLHGAVAAGRATSGGDAAWVADEQGLVKLPVSGAAPTRAAGGTHTLGTPARPVTVGGVVYAAWLGQTSGTLWRQGDGLHTLSYGGKTLRDDRRPVISGTSGGLIVNETRSGWVWNARTAKLLPSSQDWNLDDRTSQTTQTSQQQAPVVIDPKPPVAQPDSFGVRAGSLVALPVLLNDSDPNGDVVTVDPGSVTGLDPAFGTLSVTDNGQRLAVDVAADAHGTATFRYRDTDGTAPGGGLYSAPTTVTLSVVPPQENHAPQWCGVDGCLATWPSPQVAPGGTVTVPVMNGWVDPDGDPVMLLSATDPDGTGAVAVTPAGDVVYQHSDPSADQATTAELKVVVGDPFGATTTRTLSVRVTPKPKVSAESFALTTTAGAGLSVDVASHVSGTQGRLSLSNVRVLDDAAQAQAVAAGGGTTFDFTATAAGVYRVAYTVDDGTGSATATVRITVQPKDAPAQLATAPVTAFVHPQQDATLDVFAAVSNPTRRVLLLSDITSQAARGSSLSVDAVGQNYLRVSGSTADGAPGLLGTVRYVVSDGTSDAGARVVGQATVYLLPPAAQLAPIAVDDTVVVRAGAQADIPVLDNDVSTSGGAVMLNPASVRSSTPDALAFASGRLVRYLAPPEEGDYRVQYSVYTAGNPALSDTGTVHVRVISNKANRPPRPRTLTGRVLTGQQVSIPFDSFGVDPDGDDVTLDRVMTQPASGSAAISADGGSIVYTSVPGFHGQVSFTYRVVDAFGATGTATVRVGVLDDQTNPSPVTFTDYVQLQVGADNSVRVDPMANDIDPTGGTLSLTDVAPDVVRTFADGTANPEYTRLKNLLSGRTKGGVVIHAGTAPGTMSYLYDVTSASGNTARGLIVVKVVREAVPDYPVVADTVLTAQTRDDFSRGVDVVSGQVAWTGGDVSNLKLGLWGSPDGVSVSGTRLRGRLTDRARIIPFSLTGTGRSGQKVTSYGFLRIPSAKDVTLALKSGVGPQQVTEKSSVTWDMTKLVALPRGASIEVDTGITTTKTRGQATCTRVEDTKVRYDAGAGAPWADACVVPVRLAGQSEWTYLTVPVDVTALAPVPVLAPASITAGPGETVSYDLKSMTSWQGRTDWDHLVYTTAYNGRDFTVTRKDSLVTVVGADNAVPGDEEVVVVGVSSHPGVQAARLILRVGAAPSALPRGGTVAQRCSEASGSSCVVGVVGVTGEVNPLPRTPLQVVDVRAAGACNGISFQVADAAHVRAAWTGSTPGQTCTASFSVRDAQGRITAGDGDGQILLDLQGYPKAPSSIVQSGYGDGTVTLRVNPGEASLAYPALTGFTVRSQGQTVATCAPDGTCPVINAPNGEQRTYTANAVNAVGESAASVSTTAWAYNAPPSPGTLTAAPVVTSDGSGGVVSVQITGLDPGSTAGVRLTSDAGGSQDVPIGGGQTSVYVPQFRIGSNTSTRLTATPYSRYTLPPGFGGETTGKALSTVANGVGAPVQPLLSLTSQTTDSSTAVITAKAAASSGGDGSTTLYGIVPVGQNCRVSDGGGTQTYTVNIGQAYSYTMCAESFVGGTSFGRVEQTQQIQPRASDRPPQGFTFVVGATPVMGTQSAQWRITATPTTTEKKPVFGTAQFGGFPSSIYGRDPGITVWYQYPLYSGAAGPVAPASGSAPYQVQARWQVSQCTGGTKLQTSSTSDGAAITFDTASVVYRDANGAVIPTPTDGLVPAAAASVSGVAVTVDWSAKGWGLAAAHDTFGATCTPSTPPAP